MDQHACIVQFLGVAEKVFSEEFDELVSKNKCLWDLQFKRDQFMTMLDSISKDLVGADELGVALTPESIEAAKEKLKKEELELAAQRQNLLFKIRSSAEGALADKKETVPDLPCRSRIDWSICGPRSRCWVVRLSRPRRD